MDSRVSGRLQLEASPTPIGLVATSAALREDSADIPWLQLQATEP